MPLYEYECRACKRHFEHLTRAGQTPGFEARIDAGLARVYARLGRYKDMANALKRAANVSAAGAK